MDSLPRHRLYDLALNTAGWRSQRERLNFHLEAESLQRAERVFLYHSLPLDCLALFALCKSVVLAEHQIDFSAHGFAVLNALAFAKVILIGQKTSFRRPFPKRAADLPHSFQVRDVRHNPGLFQDSRRGRRWFVSREIVQREHYCDRRGHPQGDSDTGAASRGPADSLLWHSPNCAVLSAKVILRRLFFTSRHPAGISS